MQQLLDDSNRHYSSNNKLLQGYTLEQLAVTKVKANATKVIYICTQ